MLAIAWIVLKASIPLSVLWRHICTILRFGRPLLIGSTYVGMYVFATVMCVIVLYITTV